MDDKELEKLKEKIERIEKIDIKRTFGDIIEEIARENNIPKNSLFLEFDEKFLKIWLYYFKY